MFFEFLDALRAKPKPIRERYAFVFAIGFTVMIGGVWSLSLPGRFATVTDTATSTPGEAPFAGLWREFSEQVSSLRTQTAAIPVAPAATTTGSTSVNRVDAVSLIATTSADGSLVPLPPPPPAPKPVLIGTTSPDGATTTP